MSPAERHLIVRGTPVTMLEGGAGPPLLFLHAAGGGGRWLAFQDVLAERFTVLSPTHPGHGGSPQAEWIEHISDLAFHYLDLLDELGTDRVHLAGASFGGWIAAEIATMASHRLASLVLVDPVGIKVSGPTVNRRCPKPIGSATTPSAAATPRSPVCSGPSCWRAPRSSAIR